MMPTLRRTALASRTMSLPSSVAARGGRERRREHGDHRRLPGTVRPEQREELARADMERDPIDRVPIGLLVALDQISDVDYAPNVLSALPLRELASARTVAGLTVQSVAGITSVAFAV